MRKSVLITALLVLVLAVATPVFAEIELGISGTFDPGQASDPDKELDIIPGFHVGYSWAIFYASWDAMVLPPGLVNEFTGFQRPGFLNLIDAGIRLRIGPIVTYATVGTNNIYVYGQSELGDFNPEFGANIRVGLGLTFGFWGVNLSGTTVFSSFDRLARTLQAFGGTPAEQQAALDTILDGLIPALNLTLYF
jgi:hypothetical protein